MLLGVGVLTTDDSEVVVEGSVVLQEAMAPMAETATAVATAVRIRRLTGFRGTARRARGPSGRRHGPR